MTPEVWVDGLPLTSIAHWGSLVVTHRWPLGSWEATWSQPLESWRRPPQLRAHAPVEVRVGGWCIWSGNLAEPDWDEGTFVAFGACRQAEQAICFNGSFNTTSIPNTAVDAAISRGALDWTRPASISSAAFVSGDETSAPNSVAALLDAYALSVNKRWYVDTRRAVRIASDPMAPAALVWPENGVLGVATEQQAGTVYVRYSDSSTLSMETVSYGTGQPPERGVFLDPAKRGDMSAAQAILVAQGIWSPLQAQTGWTNGLTIKGGELRSMGGQPKALWSFTAGQMLRLLGVRDMRGLAANTDVVIGESIWTPNEDTLTLNPVGKVARDFAAIVEAAGGSLSWGSDS